MVEGTAANMYRNLKGFWRRRDYQRLDIVRRCRRNNPPEVVRAANPNRRRFWKIRVVPKLRLTSISPKKFFIRLRDAYVKLMMRVADSSAVAGGGGGFGAADYGVGPGFGIRPMKEYDEKVIVEIYKSIVMNQGKLPVIHDVPENNPRVVSAPDSK